MKHLRSLRRLVPLGSGILLLAACATTPPQSPVLDEARTEVSTLAADPLAQQAAGPDLQSARNALQQAEAAQQEKKPIEDVNSLAYLALRNAQAGKARVAEAQAHQQITQAQSEREKTLLAAREQQVQSTKAQLSETQQQLADLKAKQTDRGMVVTMGDVLFDTGQATLKPGAELTVERLAKFLVSNPETRVRIEGFTDSTGSEEFNELLSQRRADAVAHALRDQDVPASQLQTVGRGEAFPVASNSTAAGRQQNRRVEIVFSDKDGRFSGPAGG